MLRCKIYPYEFERFKETINILTDMENTNEKTNDRKKKVIKKLLVLEEKLFGGVDEEKEMVLTLTGKEYSRNEEIRAFLKLFEEMFCLILQARKETKINNTDYTDIKRYFQSKTFDKSLKLKKINTLEIIEKINKDKCDYKELYLLLENIGSFIEYRKEYVIIAFGKRKKREEK